MIYEREKVKGKVTGECVAIFCKSGVAAGFFYIKYNIVNTLLRGAFTVSVVFYFLKPKTPPFFLEEKAGLVFILKCRSFF